MMMLILLDAKHGRNVVQGEPLADLREESPAKARSMRYRVLRVQDDRPSEAKVVLLVPEEILRTQRLLITQFSESRDDDVVEARRLRVVAHSTLS